MNLKMKEVLNTTQCPICGSNMKTEGYYEDYIEFCSKNKCYYTEFAYGTTRIYVFDEEFYSHYTFDDDACKNLNNDIDAVVAYWKENERYVMKIMELSL